MKKYQLKKLILTGLFAGIAVIGSSFSFPILGAKCAPIQHLINILSAVLLGPGYALGQAFTASLIRNLLSLGTLLAFPGSLFGALLSGLLYRLLKRLPAAYFGELFGTSVLGGLVAYPIASAIMGNDAATLTGFVVPFLISTAGGSLMAFLILSSLYNSGHLKRLQDSMNEDR